MAELRSALLAVHLLALVGWLGLSTGAWLLLRKIERDVKPDLLWRAFARIVDIEHLFLGLLVASGVALAFVAGWKAMTGLLWFVLKLAIVMIVIVPVECADILHTARLSADPSPEGILRYKRFIFRAGAAVITAAVAIVALGKFRPGACTPAVLGPRSSVPGPRSSVPGPRSSVEDIACKVLTED